MEDDRLLVLAGPTASGKTGAAIALARELPLEIVTADSMQVYRGMDIGTAKPARRERDEIPHHLLDIAEPDEGYSAGRFVEDAGRAIREIRARGRFPLLVGGTGLYIRALVRGLDPLPSDPRVRERLARRWEDEGGRILCAELRRTDPAAAKRIHPADRLRVLRALEVAEITGAPSSARRTTWSAGGAGAGSCSWRWGRAGRSSTGGSTPASTGCSVRGSSMRSGVCSPGGTLRGCGACRPWGTGTPFRTCSEAFRWNARSGR